MILVTTTFGGMFIAKSYIHPTGTTSTAFSVMFATSHFPSFGYLEVTKCDFKFILPFGCPAWLLTSACFTKPVPANCLVPKDLLSPSRVAASQCRRALDRYRQAGLSFFTLYNSALSALSGDWPCSARPTCACDTPLLYQEADGFTGHQAGGKPHQSSNGKEE